MIDIHYHLLFGVDDGPKTVEGSLQLAEASIAEGVTHIVCTPHSSDRYPLSRRSTVSGWRFSVSVWTGRMALGLGCDLHLCPTTTLRMRFRTRPR